MTKGRLEAFSDGVLAVVITIMVLELKVPHGEDLDALIPLIPGLLSFVVSFLYVGIYWNNHHHLMHATKKIDGSVMWANLHLLFWLCLVPLVTGWVAEHPNAPWPATLYGVVLFMAGIAWLVLQRTIIRLNGRTSALAKAIGRDTKGNVSAVLYVSAIALSFVRPWIAELIYFGVAMIWVVPDRRIEATLAGD
jgi:uncharacterized membrane protein